MYISPTKKTLATLLLGSGLLTMPAMWSSPTPPVPQNPTNPVFAQKITGTYVFGGNGNRSATLQIEADGTLTWFGTWFFGNGRQGFFNGPVYGTWKQVGPDTIESIELGYLFDSTNAWNFSGRVKGTYVFSADFKSLNLSGTEDIVAKTEDPTDPNAPLVFSFNFQVGPWRRLTR